MTKSNQVRDRIPLVDLYAQYKSIKPEIDRVIKRVIESACFINGTDNTLFEKEFADYCGNKYAIGVASGSLALDLTLTALGIKPGDEVICPAHTFTATAEAIVHQGAVPVFVDVDEASYNINPQLIAKSITKKTKAIIAVHLYGNPADMDKINNLAQKYKLWLVEDAAQAHGAIYKGKKIGSLGNIACFSFFPAKNLGCFGDGGIVVTNSKKLADRVRLLKDHGRIEKYKHIEIGYGARLDNLQAAILRVKLKYLDKWNDRRRKIAEYYDKKLKDKYIIPQVLPDITSAYYAYTLRHPQRDMIIRKLNSRGIITGIYYPMPLHLQPAYKYLGYKKRDFPVTEKICREIFSIPLYPELSKSQIDQIISVLLD